MRNSLFRETITADPVLRAHKVDFPANRYRVGWTRWNGIPLQG
jgi:hypothetical protein